MSRESLQARLDDLATAVEEMADLVLDRLRTATTALAERDTDRAQTVLDGDDAVNERYLGIEHRCIDILALRQPVASDLRLVAASFKIITDLERVGDLAVNLAEYALTADRELLPEVDVSRIASVATGMLEDAVAAYRESVAALRGDDADADDSVWRCHEVADRDTDLDALCTHAGTVIVRSLVEATDDDVDDLLEGVQVLMLTVRDLERVGDHAVNVAARTLYMTTSSDELIY
ncbi:phosphate signaling complex protein PhoU [Halomarina litorea]|uniref:phosphate signaling complex protein PhoU n=1 Tax=Halomarina litorea TaxID=2961595 RepID=UPI0020C49796|nr:phosphate signaling complex protein PhoU [Halomarina sp. BCD28]